MITIKHDQRPRISQLYGLTVAHLSIANVQMFAELLWPLFRHNNVSLLRCVFIRALCFCHVVPLSFGSRTHAIRI